MCEKILEKKLFQCLDEQGWRFLTDYLKNYKQCRYMHVLILLQRVKLILHIPISNHDMSCLFASEMLQSEDCLFYFYLNLVCCFVCEVQSSDIVSSVCQTVNIDCAIND